MAIDNYGELRTAVQLWIDRDDEEVVNRIPLFINLAEKELYRVIRMPANEISLVADVRADGSIRIPRDLIQLKYLTGVGTNEWYEQTSFPTLHGLNTRAIDSRDYPGKYFARKGASYFFYPFKEEGSQVDVTYWRDIPEMKVDSDTNVLLRVAPGLYMYTACKHAADFIGDTQKAQMYAQRAKDMMDELMFQVEEDEIGGSSITIPSFGGY